MTNKNPIIDIVTRTVYYLLPNLEKFNIRNDIVYGTTPTPGAILMTILYALTYALLLLVITQIAFKKKDF
jgi:ABC-type transport system involved in multi-copper enzyme maturation permease subunit